MKKKVISIICTVAALVIACTAFALVGCFFGDREEDNTPEEYIIQYTDENGVHTITVTDGMPYSLEAVPEKKGYDFLGLYDAEAGGSQYVSARGSSLAPFSDKKNMVLFPQYKAKEYILILDYQGAPVTGSRQFTVAYGSNLPELPKNLTGDHKEFTGWYTEAECKGTRISDKDGLVPLVSVLNEQNFDLSSSSVTLYAGFEPEKLKVTFFFEEGIDPEEIQVVYDTAINRVVPKTRVNGNAVLTWSKTKGGEVWNGKVTDDNMVLYAVEYAPVIDFDVNGGKDVIPLVAREGDTVALPTPTHELAKFMYWEDMSGNRYTSTTMPTKSTTLKAIWQAKLVFDENGGSDVDNISEKAGTNITLPTPEKEGFIFAGWYTTDKEQYTSTTMPASGVALKAGWYKELSKETVVISSSTKESFKVNKASINNACYKLDYTNYSLNDSIINIRINGHFEIKSSWAKSEGAKSAYLEVYSQRSISSSYLLSKKVFSGVTGDYRGYDFQIRISIADDAYLCFYHECPYSSWTFDLSDFYYTVKYPDTSNLYL